MWVSIWVARFSEAEWPECLGECVDLGFDLGGRTEGEFVDEFAYQTGSKSWKSFNINNMCIITAGLLVTPLTPLAIRGSRSVTGRQRLSYHGLCPSFS